MKLSMSNLPMVPVFLALSALTAQAADSLPSDSLADDVIGNLYTMRSVYRAEYAPAAWKKKYAGYDLDTEFSKAIAAIQANPNLTLKDSRKILMNFIYAMKDYHTSISFVSTEAASLPLSIKGTADKFFIVYIDRTKLPESSFPYHVGDQVVTFDGQPTAQALAAVQGQIPANVPGTDKALAEIYLTSRRAARGLAVPQGPVTLGVQAAGSTQVSQTELLWEYTPEKINPRGALADDGFVGTLAAPSHTSGHFHPMMNVRLAEATSLDNPYDLGGKKTFTPDLGAKIWQSGDDANFYAYIYKTADRKLIGYVRIPQYEAADYGKAVAEFAKTIELFQATTDSMVIDQVNNPGGSVFYLYALASMLTDQPLATPRHHMAITQADVSDALTQIQQALGIKNDDDAKKAIKPGDLDGYPPSYEFVQFGLSYARFIVSEWNAGYKLTRPYWIGGVDHINPAPVHYTKPILLLINHLDFSGGDFFPTIMQDNKRVTILGARTAGAGGYVNDVKVPNNIGVDAFRCTESIAERVDGNPIENLGVKPDLEYEMTEADFAKDYAPYVKAIQAAVQSITK